MQSHPDGRDVGSEVQRLRTLSQDAPILVLGLQADPQVVLAALLAGARGFIHAGINPTQIIGALSASSRGEIVVSRKLLEEFLSEIGLREDLILTPRQREILELLAEAATPEGGVVMPRKLLEAFLMEVVMT